MLIGGTIVAAPMGDPNASIPTPQPVHYRPMFGAFGRSLVASPVLFVSQASHRQGRGEEVGAEPAGCWRSRARARSARRTWCTMRSVPRSRSIPETYEVRADGELLTCEPATVLPMAQRYFLF